MERTSRPLVAMFALSLSVFLALSGGCGSKKDNQLSGDDQVNVTPGDDDSDSGNGGSNGGGSGSSSGGGSSSFGGSGFSQGGDGGAVNDCPANAPLSCYVDMKCPGGKHTTITGKVYDPAGKNPLYNVVVFVPNDPKTLPAITPGTNSCNTCTTPVGDYVAVTLTAKDGSFTLTDVPWGKNLPLVVQIGKWRRIINVPSVSDCGTTTLPDSGNNQARLPRNRMEGDMPQMALLTGGLDDLGCFMTRMGIDASEYASPHSGGRLDIYQGFGLAGLPGPALSSGQAGNCTSSSCPLWASKQNLQSYDIVLLACEGDTYDAAGQTDGGISLGGGMTNVTTAGKQAMHDWLNEGGKVFATHFHYTWFANGPADFQGVATWLGFSTGTGNITGTIDTTFPKGQTFSDWLQLQGALTNGGIALTGVASSVSTVNQKTTQRWIYDHGNMDETKYLTFETPIGGVPLDGGEMSGVQYCGKAVFSDLHAGGAPMGDVPSSCKAQDLSPQEKALEFLFFDLAACVTDDTKPPVPPPPPPK